MPIQDEVDDLKRSDNDHDLLIRLHERIIALGSTITSFIQATQNQNQQMNIKIDGCVSRIESLERVNAGGQGEKSVYGWLRTALTSIIVGLVVGIILYVTKK